jgi:hypothetical protein
VQRGVERSDVQLQSDDRDAERERGYGDADLRDLVAVGGTGAIGARKSSAWSARRSDAGIYGGRGGVVLPAQKESPLGVPCCCVPGDSLCPRGRLWQFKFEFELELAAAIGKLFNHGDGNGWDRDADGLLLADRDAIDESNSARPSWWLRAQSAAFGAPAAVFR